MKVLAYVRRAKSDAGKQEFSLETQNAGCRDWKLASPFAASKVVPYADDGIAGDDFRSRDDLNKLLAQAKPGDVVVSRDQSRLGRDALEATLVVRDIVRDRGCRLFYYIVSFRRACVNWLAAPAYRPAWTGSRRTADGHEEADEAAGRGEAAA